MHSHRNRLGRAAAGPRCIDCNGSARHQDTCPTAGLLADLLDPELARLRERGGRPFTRRLHPAEVTMIESATGHRVSRRDRHRFSVLVELHGPDAVRRTIRADGQWVADLVDEPVFGQATL